MLWLTFYSPVPFDLALSEITTVYPSPCSVKNAAHRLVVHPAISDDLCPEQNRSLLHPDWQRPQTDQQMVLQSRQPPGLNSLELKDCVTLSKGSVVFRLSVTSLSKGPSILHLLPPPLFLSPQCHTCVLCSLKNSVPCPQHHSLACSFRASWSTCVNISGADSLSFKKKYPVFGTA